ncbi:MAG: spike base protein, RCAP_Rcc01079 family [Maritimibacter sp.]
MSNPFENRAASLHGPVNDIVPVTPDDNVDLADVAVALYIETGGAVTVITEAEATRTLTLADNAILPVGVRRVLATGTDATGIHAFMVK